MKYLIICASLTFTSCLQKEQCFEKVDALAIAPTEVDTVILFDKNTYDTTCQVTELYDRPHTMADSTITDGEQTVKYAWSGRCWKIISIQRLISCEAWCSCI